MFCLLDLTACFSFLAHSLYITLYSTSPGLCSLQQLYGFRNCYTIFPHGTQCFMEVTTWLNALNLVLSPAEMDGDCSGTPKSHVFTADPVLGWGDLRPFLTSFYQGGEGWDGN